MTDREANELVDRFAAVEKAMRANGYFSSEDAPISQEEVAKQKREMIIGVWTWIAMFLLLPLLFKACVLLWPEPPLIQSRPAESKRPSWWTAVDEMDIDEGLTIAIYRTLREAECSRQRMLNEYTSDCSYW